MKELKITIIFILLSFSIPVLAIDTEQTATETKSKTVAVQQDSSTSTTTNTVPKLTEENLPIDFETIIMIFLGIVLLGIILGLTNKTTIFYDYDDMGLCFGTFAVPVVMTFIMAYLPITRVEYQIAIVAIPTLLVFSGVLYKTWISGVRFTFPIVLLTKLFLGLFYILALWQMLSPSGKNRGERRNSRAKAVFALLVFTPLIAKLVKNKEGSFFSPSMIKGQGIRGAGKIRDGLK